MSSPAAPPIQRPAILGMGSAVRRTGVDRTIQASRIIVVATIALGAIGVLGDVIWAPLGIALLVGLPHGAVDHAVLARRFHGLTGIVIGTVAYATLAGVVFIVAGALPEIIWTAFLLFSVWHFGTADRSALDHDTGAASWLYAIAMGLIPVGGLMVIGAADLRPLAVQLSPQIAFLLDPSLVTVVAVVTVAVVALVLSIEVRQGRWANVGEVLALATLFVVVPPLWAFGVYFGAWHAPRHVARLLQEEEPYRTVTLDGGHAASLRRFIRDAALPTTAALATFGVLLSQAPAIGEVQLTALALQITAAVTFPHVITVAYLDRFRPAASTRATARRATRSA